MLTKEQIKEQLKEDLMRARTAHYMKEARQELERQHSQYIAPKKIRISQILDYPLLTAISISGLSITIFSIIS